ncbi:MAG TPA: HD domain-containing phosphohydrolase [Anaerolineaceae bacterium]|nr:HD domain-containing phosphohydrolase [Anaerolineaceae bacterium]HQF46604.1 HD domain-containing phosphohydrolase [Anaerolineaceae bacterium]HQH36505.1 HD domain-containing phosphohydrolase [Anaerolineaceae bacterium]HQO98236.1 HD domain-containing phosphohydrolase [Anaerolineaceae bacterium]HQP62408.1 HD domain-containing phosphohydrolase [Anaerolineaceae bacterium]
MLDYYPKNRTKEQLDLIVRLAYMAEIKEWDCRPHIERIRRYCHLIGSEIGIEEQHNEMIAIACQLHDIGKIMIPEDLLHKDGKYDNHERELIERHTIDGAKILEGSPAPLLQVAASIALTHQERWDGSGYPNHLKGDEIPLVGRICAIADVFDALTTRRAYKPTIATEEALQLIIESSNILFDPSLVQAFKRQFDEIKKIRMAIGD